jgi:hypothetical protein
METPALGLGPVAVPLGTKVGGWRVYSFRGRGTYGTVYRAVSQERADVGPVALKLAMYSGDPRFEREVELLSRIRHPSVPRLLDAGEWRSPEGGLHPFVVMEWVEGEPLYEWAARRNPSSRQVLGLLAQAAGALQATHEVSAVHRDVKGDNMLVRPSDGRLFLTDFGTGYFAGAARLTPAHLLPGTPEYHSPELRESIRYTGTRAATAALARPGDDVFALGVTAYRLVTDTYPPSSLPASPRQLNPRVDAQLNALILRMLSLNPEERGSAQELAQAKERGAAHAGPSADERLFEWERLRPSQWTEEERAEARYLGHRPRRRYQERALEAEQADAVTRAQAERREAAQARARAREERARRWLPWLAAAMALGLWPHEPRSGALLTEEHSMSEARRRRPVSLGDTALNSSAEREKAPAQEPIAREMPTQPQPGQLKPDAKGRCPGEQIAINGGCWGKLAVTPEYCPGSAFLYQGGCYIPTSAPKRAPTSAPSKR